MNTNQQHSIQALLNSSTISSFINRKFIWMHLINTQKISWPIAVFNVNGTANEASQISKVIDIVLQYKTHSEWMLLTIFNLDKQDLILGYL